MKSARRFASASSDLIHGGRQFLMEAAAAINPKGVSKIVVLPTSAGNEKWNELLRRRVLWKAKDTQSWAAFQKITGEKRATAIAAAP